MVVTRCPLCGNESLEEHHGEYSLKAPANTPGDTLVIPFATWQSCTNCGEELLPRSLTKALENEQRCRLSVVAPANH